MAPHLGHHLPEHSPPEPILLDQINLRLINETERTVRCVLQRVDTEAIKKVLIQWKADQQPMRPTVAHLDGKPLKNAARLPHMHLTGRCVTADATHTNKANARQLTLSKGADYLLFLNGNQPHAFAKAQHLLSALSPSGRDA